MPLHVSSICTHDQEVKIALHSLWYHHNYRWPSLAPVHETATYRCDDTRGCVMQFWPTDHEHMCSKHVEAWNKLTAKQKFFASNWLITEINILRCTVSKTSKLFLCFISQVMILLLSYLTTRSYWNVSIYPVNHLSLIQLLVISQWLILPVLWRFFQSFADSKQ